jgi:biotin carboxylase
MADPVTEEPILLIGYGAELLAGIAPAVPERSVLVVEEPEVARRRDLAAVVAGVPAVSRLVECPYQLPGALREYLTRSGTRGVTAVIPAIEYAVAAAADAAELLGLPGAGRQAAAAFRDKHRLRHLAASAGLRNPRHALVTSPAQAKAFLASAGGRCVLKPTARQGSLGVQHVGSPAEIDTGWEMTADPAGGAVVPARGIPSQVLAEEAVTGPEFSVEMLVCRGTPCFANVTAKHLFPGRFPVERGHDLPVRDAGSLVAATTTLAAAARMSDGILHAEWIVHDGEPVLVECAARIPGGQITRLIRIAYDFPLISAYLDVMRGVTRPAPAGPAVRGAAIRYLTAPPGAVTGIAGLDEAARMPGVDEVRMRLAPGEVVRPLTVSGNRAGFIIARGADAAAAATAAEAAVARIEVSTAPRSVRA